MKKTIMKYLSAAAVLLSAVSCTMDLDTLNGRGSDKMSVSFTVGLEGQAYTRAEHLIDGDDYTKAESTPEISDGTRATYLIYALYDNTTGEIVPLPDPSSKTGELTEHVKGVVTFPTTISLDLVRGTTYTMVFWAQKGSELENRYYDTSNLKAIRVYYNADGYNANNDENRDAFCASLQIDEKSAESDISVILRRPFAQVNVGVSKKAWETLKTSEIFIKESAININNVAWNINLFDRSIVDDVNDVDGNTQSFKKANFSKSTIPYYMKINDNDPGEHMLSVNVNDKTEEYYWLSMSYVLVAGNDQSSVVDINNIEFFYADQPDSETAEGLLTPSFTYLENVPVRRNYRTNILFDNDLTGSAKIVLDLNKKYDDDFNSEDGGESWDGRIARGVSVKSYRNVPVSELPEDKKSHYNLFWLDFNVSSVEGLKWIARRSNAIPFAYEDIPTWKNRKGEITTYKEFQDADGNPSLDAYITAVAKLIDGHGLINNKANSSKVKNADPWTFDDATIILLNDIDFGGEVWREPISTIYNKRAITVNDSTSPIITNAFKGVFDGNGHTIMNVHLDSTQYTSDEEGTYLHEGAGLIGVATELSAIKNLRLYNVEVSGDWNIGSLVGFYGGKTLEIDNVKLENCRLNAVAGQNVNGDSNLGGLVGSLQGEPKSKITNCQIVNTTMTSAYLVGGLVGALTPNGAIIKDCMLHDVYMVLSSYNQIGNYKDFTLNKRTDDPFWGLLFGDDIYGKGSFRNLEWENIDMNNVGLGIFSADNKWNSDGLGGVGTIENLPVDKFPVLESKYGKGINLQTSITGTPSHTADGKDFGLFVDMFSVLDPSQNYREPKTNDSEFTIAGVWDDDSTDDTQRLNTMNVKPGANDTYAIGFVGNTTDKATATVKNMIIDGVPAIKGGIWLDNIDEVVLENIAIYDVAETIAEGNVPQGATLTVSRCDLRGDTAYSSNYSEVTFTQTAFYLGTGASAEIGKCKPGCSTTFTDCHFREGFTFELPEGFNGTLTFEDCYYGKAREEIPLTEENIAVFLGLESNYVVNNTATEEEQD